MVEDRLVETTAAEVGRRYEGAAAAGDEFHYVYRLELGELPDKAVRLRTEINDGLKVDSIYPLRVEVRYEREAGRKRRRGRKRINVPLFSSCRRS